jgi:hypothetical protein|tara:strand:- start:7842 stop:8090 length:249 start_codon:yes stop_codon:yes gene_type:complete
MEKQIKKEIYDKIMILLDENNFSLEEKKKILSFSFTRIMKEIKDEEKLNTEEVEEEKPKSNKEIFQEINRIMEEEINEIKKI